MAILDENVNETRPGYRLTTKFGPVESCWHPRSSFRQSSRVVWSSEDSSRTPQRMSTTCNTQMNMQVMSTQTVAHWRLISFGSRSNLLCVIRPGLFSANTRWLWMYSKVYRAETHTARANSRQVVNLDGVGYRLATHLARVGCSWIELAWILIRLKVSPNSSHVFHRLAYSTTSSQVVLQLLGGCAVVVR